MEYTNYQPNTQNYGASTSYSSNTSYTSNTSYQTPDIVIQSTPRKGRCPTGGRCQVCTRLCMMD